MKKLLVCTNFRANPLHPSCKARGSAQILAALAQANLGITLEESPCMGHCEIGPNARLVPSGPFIHTIKLDELSQLIEASKTFSRK